MRFSCCWLLVLAIGGISLKASALTIDFEDLPFPTHPLRYKGDDGAGGFDVAGVSFNNHFTDFGGGCCWEGFAYSRETEVPPIETNSMLWNYQYVAWPGSGSDGSSNYVVVFSGIDAGEGGLTPRVTLPAGAKPESIDVTNIVYAALSVRHGDGYGKKFGGESGTDPDWFRMDVEAHDFQGEVLGKVEFYLADYRGDVDTIVDTWQTLDLSPLALPGLTSLSFRFDSSDRSPFGLATPAFAALDNLVLSFPIAGDYNGDGRVDAADFTVWRNTFGSTEDLAADGNLSGEIDTEDYLIWKEAYAAQTAGFVRGSEIPEPASALLLVAVAFSLVVAARYSSKL